MGLGYQILLIRKVFDRKEVDWGVFKLSKLNRNDIASLNLRSFLLHLFHHRQIQGHGWIVLFNSQLLHLLDEEIYIVLWFWTVRLELDQEGHLQLLGPGDKLLKGGDMTGMTILLDLQSLHLSQGHIFDILVHSSQAFEIVIMHDDELMVLGQEDIHLDIGSLLLGSCLECFEGIFYTLGHIATMGYDFYLVIDL